MQASFVTRSSIGTYNEDWHDVGFHRHPTLEISVVLEGRGLFEWTERQAFIETGHVIVIPPELPHRFAAVTKVRFGVFHLKDVPAQLAELLRGFSCGDQPKIFALSRIDKDRYERLFREWLRVKSSSLKNRETTCAAWVAVLVLFLQEHSQTDLQAMTITKAADYIRQNLRHNVHISDLAELAGLTVAGFRRVFERMYHMSPKQYQQQCRMHEAKWLLSATDKDMKEIAEQVGFSRMHSFSQWFKTMEGVSPSVWRKRQQMNGGWKNT